MESKQKEVIFRATNRDLAVQPFDEWMGEGGENDIHPFFHYKLTEDEEYAKDSDGNKIPTSYPSPSDPKTIIPRRFEFKIGRGKVARFLWPKQRDIIDALRNCPHNRDCNNIDGVDYSNFPKRFYEYDPVAEEKTREEKMNLKYQVADFASTIKKEIGFLYALVLGVPLQSDVSGKEKSSESLYLDIRDYADKNPQQFKSLIIENEDFQILAMVKFAIHKGMISKNNDGYYMDNKLLGTTESRVMEFLKRPEGVNTSLALESRLVWTTYSNMLSGERVQNKTVTPFTPKNLDDNNEKPELNKKGRPTKRIFEPA